MRYFELIIILLTMGCAPRAKDSLTTQATDSLTNNTKPTTNDSTTKAKTEIKRVVTIIVKDSTRYSKTFLQGLRDIGPGTKFELIDNLIITDDRYRNDFGQILPDNKDILLKAERNGNKYQIKVRQVNLTTISYDFEFIDNNGQKTIETGLAHRSPQFMLGPETDSDESDKTYACTEYFTEKQKCLFSIRLGILDKLIVGRLKGCNDNLDYFKTITLRM